MYKHGQRSPIKYSGMILSGVIPETVQPASMVSQSIISFTKLSRLHYPFALCLLYYKLSVLRDEDSI